MSNFILYDNKKQKIESININKSYVIEGKKNYQKIEIYDEEKINILATKNIAIKYQKLLKFLKEKLENESSGTNEFKKCLDRIEKFRQILEIKYKSLIKKELYKKYLEYLMELSKYFHNKIIEYEQINHISYKR